MIQSIIQKEQYKLGNEIAAIENLERLDIVRDVQTRWDETSLITRRDALKIAYVFNTSSRDFISWVNSYSSERLKSELEEISWSNGMNGYYGKFRTARKFEFCDIEPLSYDYKLAASLFLIIIYQQEKSEMENYMQIFDDNVKYNEAFITI